MMSAARDQALEALRPKVWILANVSHNVRTPLNVIMLRCEMLLHGTAGPLEPGQKKFLKRSSSPPTSFWSSAVRKKRR